MERVGAATWMKTNLFFHFRMAGKEGVDGAQAVENALGVVEALDADAEPYLLGEAVATANRGAAFRHRLLILHAGGRPFDRDRIGPDEGLQVAEGDARLLAIDTRFHEAIDGVEEIVAMELRVETNHGTAQQARDDFLLPWTDAEDFRVRPRNMPERDDGGVWQFIAEQARQQREVVVLDQDHRIGALGFVGDGLERNAH